VLTVKCFYNILVENPGGKRSLGKPGHRREVILKWIFMKQGVKFGLGSSGTG
jgi:hypothetical protein